MNNPNIMSVQVLDDVQEKALRSAGMSEEDITTIASYPSQPLPSPLTADIRSIDGSIRSVDFAGAAFIGVRDNPSQSYPDNYYKKVFVTKKGDIMHREDAVWSPNQYLDVLPIIDESDGHIKTVTMGKTTIVFLFGWGATETTTRAAHEKAKETEAVVANSVSAISSGIGSIGEHGKNWCKETYKLDDKQVAQGGRRVKKSKSSKKSKTSKKSKKSKSAKKSNKRKSSKK